MNGDTPEFLPQNWHRRKKDWKLIGDVYDRLANCEITQYLNQAPGETDRNYQIRSSLAVFDGNYPDSIDAHAALLSQFSVLPETSPDIVKLLDDVDGVGNDLKTFAQGTDISCLNYGAVVIFVDPGEGMAIPPRLRKIELTDIRCPRVAAIDGKLKLVRLGVKVSMEEDKGEFETEVVDKWYIYYPGYFQVYVQDKKGQFVPGGQPVAMRGANGQLLTEIPAVWYSTNGSKSYFDPPIPPFLTLAQLSIKLLNKTSELDNVESKCNSPTWYKKHNGVPDYPAPLEVGANACINLEIEEEAGLIEPKGTAIAVTHERIKHLEEKMDRISQAFITGGEVERTATETLIESAQSKASLQGVAHAKESAYQQVFKFLEIFTNPRYKDGDEVGGIDVDESAIKAPPNAQDIRTIFDGFSLGVYDRNYALAKLREIGWEPEELEDEDLTYAVATDRPEETTTDFESDSRSTVPSVPAESPNGRNSN